MADPPLFGQLRSTFVRNLSHGALCKPRVKFNICVPSNSFRPWNTVFMFPHLHIAWLSPQVEPKMTKSFRSDPQLLKEACPIKKAHSKVLKNIWQISKPPPSCPFLLSKYIYIFVVVAILWFFFKTHYPHWPLYTILLFKWANNWMLNFTY